MNIPEIIQLVIIATTFLLPKNKLINYAYIDKLIAIQVFISKPIGHVTY